MFARTWKIKKGERHFRRRAIEWAPGAEVSGGLRVLHFSLRPRLPQIHTLREDTRISTLRILEIHARATVVIPVYARLGPVGEICSTALAFTRGAHVTFAPPRGHGIARPARAYKHLHSTKRVGRGFFRIRARFETAGITTGDRTATRRLPSSPHHLPARPPSPRAQEQSLRLMAGDSEQTASA